MWVSHLTWRQASWERHKNGQAALYGTFCIFDFWHDNDESVEKDIKANGSGNSGDQICNIDSHHTWVDDRSDPMYVRADSQYSNENGEHIDKLLEEHHQYALKKRVVSNASRE